METGGKNSAPKLYNHYIHLLPCSATALAASSGDEKQTKPNPLLIPFSVRITLAEIMVP
mgnify:CR=1 FL=1